MSYRDDYPAIHNTFKSCAFFSVTALIGLLIFLYDPEIEREEVLALQSEILKTSSQVVKSCDIIKEFDENIAKYDRTPEEIMKNTLLRKEYIVQKIKDRELIRRQMGRRFFDDIKDNPIIEKALNAPCLTHNIYNDY